MGTQNIGRVEHPRIRETAYIVGIHDARGQRFQTLFSVGPPVGRPPSICPARRTVGLEGNRHPNIPIAGSASRNGRSRRFFRPSVNPGETNRLEWAHRR